MQVTALTALPSTDPRPWRQLLLPFWRVAVGPLRFCEKHLCEWSTHSGCWGSPLTHRSSGFGRNPFPHVLVSTKVFHP